MPYDLHQLGDERFEHLTQALALQVFGPGLTIFGAGTDGGRVSVLNIARYIRRLDPATADFLPHGFEHRTFNPSQCPWTGGSCP